MKGLLVVILIVVIAFVAVGTWQGWFTASASEGKTQLTVDTDKAKRDADRAWDKIKAAWAGLSDKAKSTGESAQTQVERFGREISSDKHEVEGTLTDVNTEDKIVTLRVNGDTIDLPHILDAQTIDSLMGREVKATVATTANGAIVSGIEAR